MEHLKEKTVSKEIMYNGKIIDVARETAELEDGSLALRDVVYHSGGVGIVPLDENGNILFVRQFRYPFKEALLEIPAGKKEKGEDPLTCGVRELSEEVGARSGSITDLGKIYPTVAYDTEVIHLFLAQELEFFSQSLDDDEFLDVEAIALEKAFEMVMNNEIPDAKTQIAVLKTYYLINKNIK